MKKFYPIADVFQELEGRNLAFPKAAQLYYRELGALSSLRHPYNGESLFSGLGLYPEGGADPGPYLLTSCFGKLVHMSLHEGELSSLVALAVCYGFDANTVLGSNLVGRRIGRDFNAVISTTFHNREEIIERYSDGFGWFFGGPMGRAIGTKDWRNYGRMLEWGNSEDGRTGLVFLPSASGDEKILTEYLKGKKINHLWLKGSLQYRYSGNLKEYCRWLETLHTQYLAPDAAVIISRNDREVTDFLLSKGYLHHPHYRPNFSYPQTSGESVFWDFVSRQNWAEGRIVSCSRAVPRFCPIGGFDVLVRRPSFV